MKIEQLQDAIEKEWGEMHHNASIAGHIPDFRNDYEAEMFWNLLGEDTSLWIDDLKEEVAHKFGKTLTFYSYGRQGATIAPREYMSPYSSGGNGFGGCKYSVPDGLEGYNEGRKVLAMFQYINKYWKDIAKDIPRWWEETKESNGYDKEIADHDGKTKRMVEVWR